MLWNYLMGGSVYCIILNLGISKFYPKLCHGCTTTLLNFYEKPEKNLKKNKKNPEDENAVFKFVRVVGMIGMTVQVATE
jgi:hypothetical protein